MIFLYYSNIAKNTNRLDLTFEYQCWCLLRFFQTMLSVVPSFDNLAIWADAMNCSKAKYSEKIQSGLFVECIFEKEVGNNLFKRKGFFVNRANHENGISGNRAIGSS